MTVQEKSVTRKEEPGTSQEEQGTSQQDKGSQVKRSQGRVKKGKGRVKRSQRRASSRMAHRTGLGHWKSPLAYRGTVPDAIKLQYNSKGTLYTVQYSTTYIYTVLGGKAVYRKNKTEDWFRSGFFISALTAAEPKLNTKLSKTVILTVNTTDREN